MCEIYIETACIYLRAARVTLHARITRINFCSALYINQHILEFIKNYVRNLFKLRTQRARCVCEANIANLLNIIHT